MTIEYYTKNVFGNELTYLANDDDAWRWKQLTGKKTLTATEMDNLNILTGCVFKRVFEASNA